jgi:hypothetical protein
MTFPLPYRKTGNAWFEGVLRNQERIMNDYPKQNKPDEWKWSLFLDYVARNPNCTKAVIDAYPEYQWHESTILNNHSIWSRELAKKRLVAAANKDKSYEVLLNPDITFERLMTVHKSSKYIWSFHPSKYDVSIHPSVTPEVVLAHPHIKWDWESLNRNPNMTLEFLQKNKIRTDVFLWITNPNCCREHLKNHMDSVTVQTLIRFYLPYDDPSTLTTNERSSNPTTTWEIVEKYPNLEWDYWVLFRNSMDHPSTGYKAHNDRQRVAERTRQFHEELVAYVFHPDRAEKWWDIL